MTQARFIWRRIVPIMVLLFFVFILARNIQSATSAPTPTLPSTPVATSVPPVTTPRANVAQAVNYLYYFPLVMAGQPVSPTPVPTSVVPTSAVPTSAVPTSSVPTSAVPTSSVPAPDPGPAGWNQLGGNPQRTHFVEANLPAPTGGMENRVNQWRMLWTWNGPTASGGPDADHVRLFDSVVPIVGAGRLYVGDDAGNVRAINATNGTEVWVRNVGGRILDAGAYDPTTQAVFFASTNGILYKLRADTGAIMGQLNTGSSIEGAVLLVGNRVYVGNAAGRLIAVNTTDMSQAWSYNASAALYASSAYSAASDGMIIFPAEDGSVHAVRAADGSRAWRTQINSFPRPERRNQLGEIIRPERRFPDVYPVVAEQAGVVIMRSYFDWELTWTPTGGAFADQEQTRQHIAQDRRYESLFVLELSTGQPRFTAPVMGGAMGNGNYYYSSPPQATVRRLANGTDVAYVLWRNRDVCRLSAAHCDGREDTTFGEMNLTTGSIRFIQDYKNEGTIRFPTDEQGPLSMVGNVLFHGHWMSMGSIYIADRATGGESYNNPIPSQEYLSVTNTMAANQCNQRNAAERFCPVWHTPPGDGQSLDPGFYLYTHNEPVYDLYWHPPTRGPIFDNGVLYWRSSDGAIVALAPR